jgi:hypothetical protein
MSTRSKQSNIGASGQPNIPEGTQAKAVWLPTDEQALVVFLKKHKAEAGDGGNFKGTTWAAAAVEMEKHRTKGAPKKAQSCQTKWTSVRNPFDIYYKLLIIQ